MIDTHAHLDFESFDPDRSEVIARFFENKGKAIINIGVDQERIRKTLELSEKYENIFSAIAFHPEEIKNLANFDNVKKYLTELVEKNKKIVALGEMGLDYFHFKEEAEHRKQKELFEIQLDLAGELGLPVVLHCRDAYADLLEILESKEVYSKISKVLHCYSGNPADTKSFLKCEKLMFSFTGNITFVKKENPLLESIQMIPLERTMVETDCPFLAPVPFRGKRNEPSFVHQVIEKLAELKKLNFEEIEQQTDQNAIKFFNLRL